jgi:KaiC/GvpD/RAD55 family RecA-like ATPase
LADSLRVPLLNDLAPDGFFYGGHYIVEFDPDSLWYETSLTIAALALKKGMKTEYHVFQHYPSEAIEALTTLGVDANKLKKDGLLSLWDSYSDTLGYEAEKKKHDADLNTWLSTHEKPLDAIKSAAYWPERAKAGYSVHDKRWLHIDDNTAILLQYNDEEDLVDAWRTGALPYGIRARETPHFLAFVNRAASDSFYTKFEALCDGIIDVKAQEEAGRIANYLRIRMLRGKTFDSRWHRIQSFGNGEVRFAEKWNEISTGPKFEKPEARSAFDFLVSSFIDDYMRKRLSSEQSGWRSLVQIGESCKITQGVLYGRQGRHGNLIEELIIRGLIETRTFTGHRGRGGDVTLVRVAYDKGPVKEYVDTVALSK